MKMLNKEQLGKELAALMEQDIKSKGLSIHYIRKDKDSYPFTESIYRQLERGQFSSKRITEVEQHLGVKVHYVFNEKKLTKNELGKELARLVDADMKSKGLNEYRIRQDKSLYPFTQSIIRQLKNADFSLKRIGEIEKYLGIKVFYVIEKL